MIPSLHRLGSEAAMAEPRAVAIVLSDRERGELEGRVRRRKIAQGEIVLA